MKRLVVVVPATATKTETWQPLITQLKLEPELASDNCDWLLWDHYKSYWSCESGWNLSRQLKATIDEKWVLSGPYDDIICIGHSFGGVLVRQAYLLGAGIYRANPDISPWIEKVSRFVLVAAINRGFNAANSPIINLILKFIKSTLLLQFILFRDLLKGSVFITNLRVDWIRYLSNQSKHPKVIQLLGTKDTVVNRDDSVDIEQLPNAHHIDVPDANHWDIHKLERAKNPQGRYQLIKEAILSDKPVSAKKRQITFKNPVVFILHGIRDSNSGWVEQIRSKIVDREPNAEVITASYGYFSAFNFLWPNIRKNNIDWFLDRYSYYFARYPNAYFYFIGHSNGTYILGESLKKVFSIRFKRVYLAGSVLPREYSWREPFDLGQLEKLRNDRSSHDWPVALLCNGLRGIGMRDIGTGGFDGFDDRDGQIEEVCYYKGHHGKPLEESNLDNIIDYILKGKYDEPKELIELKEVSSLFCWFSRVAPYFTWVLLALSCVIIYFTIQWVVNDFSSIKLIPPLVALLVVKVLLETV